MTIRDSIAAQIAAAIKRRDFQAAGEALDRVLASDEFTAQEKREAVATQREIAKVLAASKFKEATHGQ